jgi:hypothetical protein
MPLDGHVGLDDLAGGTPMKLRRRFRARIDDMVITVTAVPFPGFRFALWSDGEAANPREAIVTENRIFSAYFMPDPQGWIRVRRSPSDATFFVGGDLVLSVEAESEFSLSYQWNRDGTILDETGSFLRRTVVTEADAGTYAVVISGGENSLTLEAQVTVVRATVPQFVRVERLGSRQVQAELAGPPGISLLIEESADLMEWKPKVLLPNPDGTVRFGELLEAGRHHLYPAMRVSSAVL